jgi:hypothetical protein
MKMGWMECGKSRFLLLEGKNQPVSRNVGTFESFPLLVEHTEHSNRTLNNNSYL